MAQGLAWAGALAFAALVAAPAFGAFSAAFDGLANGLALLAVAGALGAPLAALAGFGPQATLVGACALLAGAIAFPLQPRPPAASAEGPAFSIVFQNVLTLNQDAARFEAFLARARPDVIALAEITGPWEEMAASGWGGRYPFRMRLEGHGENLALLSRLPMRPVDHIPTRMLVAEVTLADGATAMVAVTHVSRPWPFRQRGRMQRSQIEAVEAELARLSGPRVLVGDFNAAPWTAVLRRMARRTGMAPVRGGAGTWPSWAPALLRLPIDNGFVGGGLVAVDRRALAPVGSDHRGILLRLNLTSGAAPLA